MRKIAEIGFSILGIYLIVSSISHQASSSFGLSSNAGFQDYLFMFGGSSILLVGGILCIVFRSYFSGWVLKWQDSEIPRDLDINRIECVLLSTLVHKFANVFLCYAASRYGSAHGVFIFDIRRSRSFRVNFHSKGSAISS